MDTRRIHYIDWLRVLAVLLLFPFHAGRVFNLGEPFYAKSPIESLGISYLLGVIDRWHMPLLFLLAGMSTYLSLRRRGLGRYASERSLRLLVPLAFGTLVLVPPQTWYGAQTNAGYTGSFVDYVTSGAAFATNNLFGRGDYYGGVSPAHLWFIMFLWVISMLVLPLLAWGRTRGGTSSLDRIARALARRRWWPLVVFIIFIGEGGPEIAGKGLIYYLIFFVLGYIVARSDAFAETAEKSRAWALGVGMAITIVTIAFWQVRDTLADPSVPLALWVYAEMFGAWLVIVGMLGYGRVLLDRPSARLSYLAESSYPVYILHQTVIVMIGFYLVRVVPWPVLGWPLLMALSVAATFLLYEGVRRVGVLRFLFGMRPLVTKEVAPSGVTERPADA